MIDFVKIRIEDPDWESLKNHPLLDFKRTLSVTTGDITGNLVANYQGLRFTKFVSNVMIIEGSLHKYKNFGMHNHDDFNRQQINDVIDDIKVKFNLDTCKCTLVNLEVGANVIPVIPSIELLRYLYMHHRTEFRYEDIKNGTLKRATYEDYQLNAYDNAQQFGLAGELFRFEIRLLRSRKIRKYGIQTLDDLRNPELLDKLSKLVLKKWREILIWNPRIELWAERNLICYNEFTKWSNPVYWTSLAKDKTVHRNYYSKEYSKVKKMQKGFPNGPQSLIAELLEYKFATSISHHSVQIPTLTKWSESTLNYEYDDDDW